MGRRDCNDQTLPLCHEGFDESSDRWFCLLPNEGYIITAVEFAAWTPILHLYKWDSSTRAVATFGYVQELQYAAATYVGILTSLLKMRVLYWGWLCVGTWCIEQAELLSALLYKARQSPPNRFQHSPFSLSVHMCQKFQNVQESLLQIDGSHYMGSGYYFQSHLSSMTTKWYLHCQFDETTFCAQYSIITIGKPPLPS